MKLQQGCEYYNLLNSASVTDSVGSEIFGRETTVRHLKSLLLNVNLTFVENKSDLIVVKIQIQKRSHLFTKPIHFDNNTDNTV